MSTLKDKLQKKGFVIDNVRMFNGDFFKTLEYAFPITIFGPIKSGKSWLIKFLIELFLANQVVDAVYVMRGAINDDYVHLEDTGTVYDGFDPKVLSDILEAQEPTKIKINGKVTNKRKPPIMIIFDDVVNDFPRETVQGKRSKAEKELVKHTVQDLFAKLRHYNVFPVVAVQQAGMFPRYVKTAMAGGISFCFNPGSELNSSMAMNLFPSMAGFTAKRAWLWFSGNKKPERHMWVIDGSTQEVGEFKVGNYNLSGKYDWGDNVVEE